MKPAILLLFASLAAHGQQSEVVPVAMPHPAASKVARPHVVPVSLATVIPAPPIAIVRSVQTPDWNGTAKMFSPKPQIVFVDEPIEWQAKRHEGYECVGFKLYRRVTK